jgi:hypothetical protein
MIRLERIKRSDERIVPLMQRHYSAPEGFVGRNICYAVMFYTTMYGAIVGGSSTLHLAGRDAFFVSSIGYMPHLNNVVNNVFFHIEPQSTYYPHRNFARRVLKLFRERVAIDWKDKYGDNVLGYETLVELPRTGDCYVRDGWQEVGLTKGYTCKRVAGTGTDSWSGRRIWNTKNLRPKRVFCKLSEVSA